MIGHIAILIYRVLWHGLGIFMPVILLWRSYKGKEDRTRLNERYGISAMPRPRTATRLYWLHGVSVGESVSSLVLAMALIKADDGCHILITSGTTTSQDMLARRVADLGLADKITCQFHPHDKSTWVRRFLDFWQPDAAVMMESEVWPNMVTMSHERNIPVLMASAQMSMRSARRWDGFARFLARPVFDAMTSIIAIDEEQARRFRRFMDENCVIVGGSMKAAAPALPSSPHMVEKITHGADGRHIVLLASSHDGEESLFLDAMDGINQSGAYLGIIAPRHLHRSASIMKLINDKGMTMTQRSTGDFPDAGTKIWLADAMGEMGSYINAADIIILGGGFAKLGGHNPMEMAAFGKGVVSGPHVFKNKTIFNLLEQKQGVIFVESASALGDTITMLAASQTMQENLNHGAAAAYATLTDAAHSTARHVIDAAMRQ